MPSSGSRSAAATVDGPRPGLRHACRPGPRADRLLVRAEDRVAALGGTLTVVATARTLVVDGEIPCGS